MTPTRICKVFVSQPHVPKRFQSTMASSDRNYAAAVQALNSLQSNFAAVEAIRKSGKTSNNAALPAMRDWVRRIGYEVRIAALSSRTGKLTVRCFILL